MILHWAAEAGKVLTLTQQDIFRLTQAELEAAPA